MSFPYQIACTAGDLNNKGTRGRLGFKNDKTVLPWLLEQIEQSQDINKTIHHLLED
jgi:hypothetical protein